MDRCVRRRSRPGFAESSLGRLPDELLLHVLRLVPRKTRVALLGHERWENDEEGAVTLTARGGAEGTCCRLRQLALSLPCTAVIHVKKLGQSAAEAEAQLRRLLPCLQARIITDLYLHAGEEVPPMAVPALLACGLFSRLRRLELSPDLLLCFTGLLALCTHLESLTLVFDEYVDLPLSLRDVEVLACQLCALPAPLLRLQLDVNGHLANAAGANAPWERLLQRVAAHVPHSSLGVSLGGWLPPPGSGLPWSLPRLQSPSISLDTEHNAEEVRAHLTCMAGLTRLDLDVKAAPNDPAPSWAGLEQLPQLRRLEAYGSLPPEAWLCPHLTALRCLNVTETAGNRVLSAPPVVACTGLRQLGFNSCGFAGPALSGALCSSLQQLTGLGLLRCTLLMSAPIDSGISQLGSLRLLDLEGTPLPLDACAVLRPLRSLTNLRLCGCDLDSLPLGACINSLISLDIQRNPFDTPVPSEVTAASRLRALSIEFYPEAASDEGWEELRSRLVCLRRLEELYLMGCSVDPSVPRHRLVVDPAAQALAARLRAECGCNVLFNKELFLHPEFGGLNWRDEAL